MQVWEQIYDQGKGELREDVQIAQKAYCTNPRDTHRSQFGRLVKLEDGGRTSCDFSDISRTECIRPITHNSTVVYGSSTECGPGKESFEIAVWGKALIQTFACDPIEADLDYYTSQQESESSKSIARIEKELNKFTPDYAQIQLCIQTMKDNLWLDRLFLCKEKKVRFFISNNDPNSQRDRIEKIIMYLLQ